MLPPFLGVALKLPETFCSAPHDGSNTFFFHHTLTLFLTPLGVYWFPLSFGGITASPCSHLTEDLCRFWTFSHQFSSVAQLCPTLCDPMIRSTPGLPVHHKLPEFTQTHVHRVGDAIQPCHPLSSPSAPALNPSQHQGLFQ